MTNANSAQAYAELETSGALSERRKVVLDAFKKYGAMTCGECFDMMKLDHNAGNIPDSNIPARCIELERMGLIARVGRRECGATGMTVTVWQKTEDVVPRKLEKRLTHRQQIFALEAERDLWRSRAITLGWKGLS